MKEIVLGLTPELADALQHLGGRDELTIGDLVREALHNDLRRRKNARARRLEKTLAPLRVQLENDVRDAVDWQDLQRRVRRKGYQFVRRGGGLSLHDLNGDYVCSAADLGHPHAQLMRQFGGPIANTGPNLRMAG